MIPKEQESFKVMTELSYYQSNHGNLPKSWFLFTSQKDMRVPKSNMLNQFLTYEKLSSFLDLKLPIAQVWELDNSVKDYNKAAVKTSMEKVQNKDSGHCYIFEIDIANTKLLE